MKKSKEKNPQKKKAKKKSHLSVSGHSEANKSLVERRRISFGHIERFVFEKVLVHLVGHRQCWTLGHLLPLGQVRGLLIQLVDGLQERAR